ncbi:hypothetical protein ACFY0G_28730 [Streptomyces sp. NPDC001552]|uniref:hypothetical protein n=1 Tax=Streptomyces sp. NPDC001552 TaxID=3364587 RepID=UPI0036972C57
MTTSPVVHHPDDVAVEADDHRQALHGGHYPDGESAGEIDRLGRWYASLGPLAAVHARIADNLADIQDPKGMGRPWSATAGAALILAAAAALVVAVLSAASL